MSKKKILFITLARIDDINVSGIYSDLISKFVSKGYDATIICPIERRYGLKSRIINSNGVKIVQVKSLNIQKTNFVEKLISTFSIEFLFLRAFYKNCANEDYDIGLFTTPPIFITNFIKLTANKRIKIKYLLLKDIFPQNALDLKMVSKFNPFYLYSRFIEKKLYRIVDFIGCMSKANLDYISNNNKIAKHKLEINPNTIDISNLPVKQKVNKNQRELKLIYGGNLGIPQNPILISKFIERIELLENVTFKIIGSGTEFKFLADFIKDNNFYKTQILSNLPKVKYFSELEKADVGLIFLSEDFSIPNYPSRLLDYLYFDLAILSNTDSNTDIPEFICKANVGKCFYGVKDLDNMILEVNKLRENSIYLESLSQNSYRSLTTNFDIDISFDLIDKKLQK